MRGYRRNGNLCQDEQDFQIPSSDHLFQFI